MNEKMKKIKIKNMTPHEVVIFSEDGERVIARFSSVGTIRLSQTTTKEGSLEVEGVEIPLTSTTFGGATLPPERDDTIYIVSSLVCQAFPDRKDLFIPNEAVRDEQGRIVGCKSLSRNPFLRGGRI